MESPIFGSLEVTRSLNAADNQLINLYPEIVETKQGKRIGALYSTPGKTLKATVGVGPIRGLHVMAHTNTLFAVSGSELYSLDDTFASTDVGTLAGGGVVAMIDNGAQLAIFTGNVGYLWTSGGGLVSLTLPFSTSLNSITAAYIDGFGIINEPGTNQIWQSDLLDLATWDALNFAQASGDSDDVLAVAALHRELWVIKQTATEIWFNAGHAGFAFQRLDGIYLEAGIIAIGSLCQLNESLVWLARNKQGEAVVVMSRGHALNRISTHSIEQMIQSAATLDQLEAATAYTYQQQGHAFYVLSVGDITVAFDATEAAIVGGR